MSGPEANQQYGLWVDRCREQLARGTAGGTLAAWMQSEGMSAEMAASVVQAAGGDPAAAFGRTSHGEDAAPTTRSQQTGAAIAAVAAPAQYVSERQTATAAIDGGLGAPVGRDGGAPLPPQTAPAPQPLRPEPYDPAPAEAPLPGTAGAASTPQFGHPATTPPPPSTLFGTPRPPVAFSPVRPHLEAPGQEGSLEHPPSPDEPAATSEPGDGTPRDIGARSHSAVDAPSSDSSKPDAAEPEPERVMDANHPAQDDGPLDEALDDGAGRIEVAAETQEPVRLRHASPLENDNPDALSDSDPDHPDGTTEEVAEEDALGGEVDVKEERGDPEQSAEQAETGGSEADDDATEAHEVASPPARAHAGKHGFGRRICNASAVPTTDGGDDPAQADREPESIVSDAAAADGAESELSRLLRDSEQAVDPNSETPHHYPEPKTDEELVAAAKELGISFREDSQKGSRLEPSEVDDEMARAVRELGIRFRDNPDALSQMDPDDPTAKAARRLGISFRGLDRPKAKQQSTLRRYWPIILLMALAAIAMPVAALLMLFYWG